MKEIDFMLPPELKALAPLLQRAEETRGQAPVVSYWCTYRAIQLGLAVKSSASDPQRSRFLSSLIDGLERDKQAIVASGDQNASLLNDEDASAEYIKEFALKIFLAADDEDRAGLATKQTAKKYLAAANFIELLRIFNKVDPELEGRVRFAKWRAGEISKAARQLPQVDLEQADGSNTTALDQDHVTPTLAEDADRSQPVSSVTQAAPTEYSPNTQVPGPDTGGTWDTAATPATDIGDTLQPQLPTSSFHHHEAVAAKVERGTPLDQHQSLHERGTRTGGALQVQGSTAEGKKVRWSGRAPEVQVAPEKMQEPISHKAIAQAQKHCRFAVSSLDYEDIEQAKKELRAALALLEG